MCETSNAGKSAHGWQVRCERWRGEGSRCQAGVAAPIDFRRRGRKLAEMKPVARVDQALVERGLCASREAAKRAVLAGRVQINQQRARKASDRVTPGDHLELVQTERYVSRGGYKLEHALREFGVDVRGLRALDVGASTGGFTDCLLQHGAARVYAVDVGRGQLAWRLRQDPRVCVMEGINARDLTAARFPQPFAPPDVAAIDCSFISLRHLLRPVVALLRKPGRIVALIKPQFEAGKAEADRGGGVITDPRVHQRVLAEMEGLVKGQAGLRWAGLAESPLLGPAGNKEFLALIETVD
jgi:23S rRNA (cytidine1920-2'-O)/16S rRNA (cytidine1409-2'-O)-methyltransferase